MKTAAPLDCARNDVSNHVMRRRDARCRPLLVAMATLLVLGCGTDVDLGGTTDSRPRLDGAVPTSRGDAGDAGVPLSTAGECEPCTTKADCEPSATCAQFFGHDYCAILCPKGNECTSAQACRALTAAAGGGVNACVPTSDACAPAPSPPSVDGGPLERCGTLNGPSVASTCHSCDKYSKDCQPNGCYGGWWCNTKTWDCQRPPTTCP